MCSSLPQRLFLNQCPLGLFCVVLNFPHLARRAVQILKEKHTFNNKTFLFNSLSKKV